MVQILGVLLAKAPAGTDAARGVHTIKVTYVFACNATECAANTTFTVDMDLLGDDTDDTDTIVGFTDDQLGAGIDPHVVTCSEGVTFDPNDRSEDADLRRMAAGQTVPSDCGWRKVVRELVIGAGLVASEDTWGDEIYVNLKMTPSTGASAPTNKRSTYVSY